MNIPVFSGPLLVVDSVERDTGNSQRLIGRLRMGGHPLLVVLDFTRRQMGFIQHVEVPWLLGSHAPSLRAVTDVMDRVNAGKSIQFPVDLTDTVSHSEPPFPFERMSAEDRLRLEREADQVDMEVLNIERKGGEPAIYSADLRLEGMPMSFEVELYTGQDRIPVMRWRSGVKLERFSASQIYAILRVLLRKLDEVNET